VATGPRLIYAGESAAELLSKDEARRIAVPVTYIIRLIAVGFQRQLA
jgi:hypothetical protein